MLVVRESGSVDKILMTLRFGFDQQAAAIAFSEALHKFNIAHRCHGASPLSALYKVNIHDLDAAVFAPEDLKSALAALSTPPVKQDFFLGITSGFQMGGFELPQNVVSYIQQIGGTVCFSYSCVSSTDD